jgi:hypothetical protein
VLLKAKPEEKGSRKLRVKAAQECLSKYPTIRVPNLSIIAWELHVLVNEFQTNPLSLMHIIWMYPSWVHPNILKIDSGTIRK